MDITQIILDDHAEQRRLFSMIEQIDRRETYALHAIWKRLQGLLDVHAEAEERFFYPHVLVVGTGGGDADSAEEETEDAIEDHNDIRDTGKAVDTHPIGSDEWFEAVNACNKANSDHMAEEERQGLTDFRRNASLATRHTLGVKFIAYVSGHLLGVTPVNKDPDEYIEAHSDGSEAPKAVA